MSTLQDDFAESQLRQLIPACALRLIIPLALGFWAVDVIVFPHLKWQLLIPRLVLVVISLGAIYAGKMRPGNLRWAQSVFVVLVLSVMAMLTTEISLTGGITSPYFYDYGMITVGLVPFAPLPFAVLVVITGLNGGPLLLFTLLTEKSDTVWNLAVANSAWLISCAVIAFFLRTFTNRMREDRMQATEQLGKTARQVAHDIRSPLTALKLTLGEFKQVPPEYLSLASEAVARIEHIANDLLGRHARTGLSASALPKVAIAPLIEQIVREKKAEFNRRSSLSFAIRLGDAGAAVAIDSGELARALSNLLNNAAEATENRPSANILIETRVDAPWLYLSVTDDGVGIAPAVLEQIRQRGFSHGKAEGHGLGLTQVRTTAELAGGSFELHSQPTVGTKATLILPIA